MPQRGFGLQTLGASAQPLFATTLSSAAVITPDFHTGSIGPGSMPSKATLPVANGNIFRYGDRVMVGTAASFAQGSTTQPDGGGVVSTASNSISVTGLQRQHSAGEWVVLAIPCAQIQIQTPTTDSGTLFLGEDSTVGVGSSTLIAEIPKGTLIPAFVMGSGVAGNVVETQKLWVSGTASDTYLGSLLTI